MNEPALITRLDTLITGNSEMAGRIQDHDWSKTPMGRIQDWSETLLATVNLMLHSPFPTVLSWGQEMVFLYNDAAIPALTAKHPSALGSLYPDVFHEGWDRVKADLEACLLRGETTVRDNVFIPILVDGVLEDHYWSYSLIPVYENGRIRGVYDAFRSTTETVAEAQRLRKNEQTQQDLSKRLAELAAIVESSDDVIVGKDLNGIITSWNASATSVFGYTADEMIGQSILKLIPKHLYSDEKIIIENIRAGRRIEHFETERLTKDGRLIEVSLTVSPIKDTAGRVIGASKILRDISSRRRMEESLLQAEKIAATGRMAATMAHEINNPLESVVNLLYLLRPMVTNLEGAGYLAAAESELGRVSHIAKQTLGYYRERTAATFAALSQVAGHAAAIYGPRCAAAGIALKTSFESSAKVMLRRGELMQVISNLITNSIYGMPEGGTISISVCDTTEPEDGVALTIADDGVGIAPDVLPKVFGAFFTTRETVGTGIGLYIAKQFVEGHGGAISIESSEEAERHGTAVCVFLPLHTAYESSTK